MSEQRDTPVEQAPEAAETAAGAEPAAREQAAHTAAAQDQQPEPEVRPAGDGAQAPPEGDGAPAAGGDVAVAGTEERETDYRDLYLRARAEVENVRKRARRDVEMAHQRGVARLARELLPALDNLDRALAHAEAEESDEEHHLTKGIRLVQQELLGSLTRVGIEPYSPKGETFDPHQHEAVAQLPAEGVESGTITEVYQQGYRYKDEVLRAAKVVVAQ